MVISLLKLPMKGVDCSFLDNVKKKKKRKKKGGGGGGFGGGNLGLFNFERTELCSLYQLTIVKNCRGRRYVKQARK